MTPPRLRLLPRRSPDGKPCYLVPSDDGSVGTRADLFEEVQLTMASELLGHAPVLLGNPRADVAELRFLASRLCESLRDTARLAESRGGRLDAYADGAAALVP
ncbi:hypothetical protein ADK38_29705, partial [Streptomyces varsoviensis]